MEESSKENQDLKFTLRRSENEKSNFQLKYSSMQQEIEVKQTTIDKNLSSYMEQLQNIKESNSQQVKGIFQDIQN